MLSVHTNMRNLLTDNTEHIKYRVDITSWDLLKWITQDSPGGQMVDKVDKMGLPELGAESEVGALPKVRRQ